MVPDHARRLGERPRRGDRPGDRAVRAARRCRRRRSSAFSTSTLPSAKRASVSSTPSAASASHLSRHVCMRRLIKQREIVVDEWRYADEDPLGRERALILPFARWKEERDRWWLWDGRLGVRLGPDRSGRGARARFPAHRAGRDRVRRPGRRPRLQPGAAAAQALQVHRRTARRRQDSARSAVLHGALRLRRVRVARRRRISTKR